MHFVSLRDVSEPQPPSDGPRRVSGVPVGGGPSVGGEPPVGGGPPVGGPESTCNRNRVRQG